MYIPLGALDHRDRGRSPASMLVIRTKHFRLGLTPARRSGHTILHVQLLLAQSAERELGMAWLWPERLDIEVQTAV